MAVVGHLGGAASIQPEIVEGVEGKKAELA